MNAIKSLLYWKYLRSRCCYSTNNSFMRLSLIKDRNPWSVWWILPGDIHVIDKDILVPAHFVYLPIMLLVLELEMPKKFLVHGWWLVFGEKMPKSIGNFVAPVRYHLMREMTVGQDCDFSAKRFITRYNSDLANDLGNFVNRLLNMVNRYCSGMISEIIINEQQEQDLKS